MRVINISSALPGSQHFSLNQAKHMYATDIIIIYILNIFSGDSPSCHIEYIHGKVEKKTTMTITR